MKITLRSSAEIDALEHAATDLLECDEDGHDIEAAFEEDIDDGYVTLERMEQAGERVVKRLPKAGVKQLELSLDDDEATFAKKALERWATMTGDFTGAWGPNVEGFRGIPLEQYDAIEETCWAIIKREWKDKEA